MIKLQDLLIEMSRGPIYHSTDLASAAKIVNSNTLARATLEWDETAPFGSARLKTVLHPGGISFSRDPRYKVRGNISPVIFQFDTDKIRQRYKMKPRVGTDLDPQEPSYKKKGEAEESVIGPIKPIDKYLISIRMDKKTYEALKKFATSPSPELKKDYGKLYKHPKLKVA